MYYTGITYIKLLVEKLTILNFRFITLLGNACNSLGMCLFLLISPPHNSYSRDIFVDINLYNPFVQ